MIRSNVSHAKHVLIRNSVCPAEFVFQGIIIVRKDFFLFLKKFFFTYRAGGIKIKVLLYAGGLF